MTSKGINKERKGRASCIRQGGLLAAGGIKRRNEFIDVIRLRNRSTRNRLLFSRSGTSLPPLAIIVYPTNPLSLMPSPFSSHKTKETKTTPMHITFNSKCSTSAWHLIKAPTESTSVVETYAFFRFPVSFSPSDPFPSSLFGFNQFKALEGA